MITQRTLELITKNLIYGLQGPSSISMLSCSTPTSLVMLDMNEHAVSAFTFHFMWIPLSFMTYVCLASLPWFL